MAQGQFFNSAQHCQQCYTAARAITAMRAEYRTTANAGPEVQSKGDVSTLQPFRLERRAKADRAARYCSDEEAFKARMGRVSCAELAGWPNRPAYLTQKVFLYRGQPCDEVPKVRRAAVLRPVHSRLAIQTAIHAAHALVELAIRPRGRRSPALRSSSRRCPAATPCPSRHSHTYIDAANGGFVPAARRYG